MRSCRITCTSYFSNRVTLSNKFPCCRNRWGFNHMTVVCFKSTPMFDIYIIATSTCLISCKSYSILCGYNRIACDIGCSIINSAVITSFFSSVLCTITQRKGDVISTPAVLCNGQPQLPEGDLS